MPSVKIKRPEITKAITATGARILVIFGKAKESTIATMAINQIRPLKKSTQITNLSADWELFT